jgi:hypothetical protein
VLSIRCAIHSDLFSSKLPFCRGWQ